MDFDSLLESMQEDSYADADIQHYRTHVLQFRFIVNQKEMRMSQRIKQSKIIYRDYYIFYMVDLSPVLVLQLPMKISRKLLETLIIIQ